MLQRFWDWLKSLFKSPVASTQPPPLDTVIPIRVKPVVKPLMPLSWEKGRSDREAWSVHLYSLVYSNLDVFDQALDRTKLYATWDNLGKTEKTSLICEFISQICYYECGWNPASSSQDVGTSNKDTWSVGLLQLSVVDQANYGLQMGYNFEDLKDPYKNMNLGIAILIKQIQKRKKIFIPVGESGLYWATIHPGGMYDKSVAILSKLQTYATGVVGTPAGSFPDSGNEVPSGSPETLVPWMDWLKAKIGMNEQNNDAELSKGWIHTDYHPGTVRGADNAWCAMTLCWALEELGYKSPHDASAISFKGYGTATELKYGAIIVIEHPSGGHHVTTCHQIVANEPGNIVVDCLGGNQQDSIMISRYNLSGTESNDKILAIRWPIK